MTESGEQPGRPDEAESLQTLEAQPAGPNGLRIPVHSVRTDGGAIASVIFGLLGILPVGLLSIAAFVLATRARGRIGNGESRGSLLAMSGLVLGLLGMGWAALFATLILAFSSCGFLDTSADAPGWCNSGAAFFVFWGAFWGGQLLIAAAIGPMSRRRWKDTGVAAGITAGVIAVIVLISVIDVATQSHHHRSFPTFPTFPGISGSSPLTPLALPTVVTAVLTDDFSDPASGWHQETTDSFTFGYVRGEYQIEVRRAGEHRYWVRETAGSYDAVRVAADVRRGSGIEGRFGVVCEANGSDQEGYVFLIDPTARAFEVRRLTGGSALVVQGGASNAIHPGSLPNSLEGYCDHSVLGGPAVLTFLINGARVAQIEDPLFSSFTGIGMYAESDTGATDARFDNLEMSV